MDERFKFNAFDSVDNIMYYDIQKGIKFDDGSFFSFDDFFNNQGYHKFTVIQSTGQKDKNDRLIFESDLAKIGNDLFVIKWNYGGFICRDIKNELHLLPLHTLVIPRDLVVIGNIHQDSHLLTQEEERSRK